MNYNVAKADPLLKAFRLGQGVEIDGTTWFYVGEGLRGAHRLPPDEARARDELQKAIQLDGDFAEAHLRLGIVLKTLGDGDGAAKHTQRGKSLDAKAKA